MKINNQGYYLQGIYNLETGRTKQVTQIKYEYAMEIGEGGGR